MIKASPRRMAAIAIALVALPISAVADTRDAFVARHRCPVERALGALLERGDRSTSRDRFMVASLKGQGQAYVQCIVIEQSSRFLCEASSGFFGSVKGTRREVVLRPDAVLALARLGFETGEAEGNFQQVMEVGRGVAPVAALILKALHDGYGARPETAIDLKGPPLPDIGEMVRECRPAG